MNIRNLFAGLMLVPGMMVAPANAENWKVFEGPNGSTQGVWSVTIEGDKISGQAQMATITSGHLGYKFSGVIDAGSYVVTRTYSSDGHKCNYKGNLSAQGDRISGAANCGESSTPWVAIRSPSMPSHGD